MRGAMRGRSSLYSVVMAVALSLPAHAEAQGGFEEHQVGFGVRLALPRSWRLDSESELSAGRERTLDRMKVSTVKELRDIAASNANTLVFRARDQDVRGNVANMNVTVGSNTKESFTVLTRAQVDAMVDGLCRVFAKQTTDMRGTGKCLDHELVTLANRKVLVLHQEANVPAAGIDNRRTVVMIPADGLLFTLSISLKRADYDPAVVRAIMASVKLPQGF